jgi:hypothetical protein
MRNAHLRQREKVFQIELYQLREGKGEAGKTVFYEGGEEETRLIPGRGNGGHFLPAFGHKKRKRGRESFPFQAIALHRKRKVSKQPHRVLRLVLLFGPSFQARRTLFSHITFKPEPLSFCMFLL